MAIKRKAAEPGVVKRIASFLGDNDYTRAWDQAAQAVVRPVDRLIASDHDRIRGLAPVFGRTAAAEGGLGPELRKHMAILDPTGAMAQKAEKDLVGYVDRKMMETGLSAEDVVTTLAIDKLMPDGATPETLRRYDDAYGPAKPVSELGLLAHGLLGNPVTAYGLPAAGVGLAAWGIHDLLAAQQQAEKESQLPLQGGVR